MKRAASSDFGRDLIQDRSKFGALALGGCNLQRLQKRRARADQGRELMKELQGVLELGPPMRLFRDPRMSHDPFLKW